MFRKIIRIRAEDSPNVRLSIEQQARGLPVTNEIVTPGVLTPEEYAKRRKMWDRVRQCIGLDADFYEGSQLLLFPPEWLNRAEQLADRLRGKHRIAKAIGIDPAEGGDNTAMSAVDELGLIECVADKTPDTNVIIGNVIAFGKKHGAPPERWCFDTGGGGKEHADRLRDKGYPVQVVAFGESLKPPIQRYIKPTKERIELREEQYAYVNRRAEMYHTLSTLLDPADEGPGFAIGAEFFELRRQLALFPKRYDNEGRLKLPPKRRSNSNSREETLMEILGCSPDEADSLVLAVFGMVHKPTANRMAGIAF